MISILVFLYLERLACRLQQGQHEQLCIPCLGRSLLPICHDPVSVAVSVSVGVNVSVSTQRQPSQVQQSRASPTYLRLLTTPDLTRMLSTLAHLLTACDGAAATCTLNTCSPVDNMYWRCSDMHPA